MNEPERRQRLVTSTPRLSPEEVIGDSFQVSVSGDSIYLNVAEMRDTIWAGVLKQRRFFFNWRR